MVDDVSLRKIIDYINGLYKISFDENSFFYYDSLRCFMEDGKMGRISSDYYYVFGGVYLAKTSDGVKKIIDIERDLNTWIRFDFSDVLLEGFSPLSRELDLYVSDPVFMIERRDADIGNDTLVMLGFGRMDESLDSILELTGKKRTLQ